MSSAAYNPADTYAAQPPPAHHVHHDSEPLPGTRGTQPAPDYSTATTEQPRTGESRNERAFGRDTDDDAVMAGAQHAPTDTDQDRPLDVQQTSQGGVAVGGQDDLPEGKVKFSDKLIGKTQKLAGKAMKNPDMHERGGLREAGGKAAAAGEARAPHD